MKPRKGKLRTRWRAPRETELWGKPLSHNELIEIKDRIAAETSKLKSTDWETHALRAICAQSPQLSKLLINGELDIETIKHSELEGILDTVNTIKEITLSEGMSLRDFYGTVLKEIDEQTSHKTGDKFYWYGQDRVVKVMQSYNASTQSFGPYEITFCDTDGKEIPLDPHIDSDMIRKVKESLDWYEKTVKTTSQIEALRKMYRFTIASEHPYIEFDLDAIENTKNFKYDGSLVNSLFIELKRLLTISADETYPALHAVTEPLFDITSNSFTYGEGTIVLIKYKGAVEYFPDRLYVELHHMDLQNWVVRWIKSYKLHLEGND